jgi:hypothetical protein
MAAKPPAGPASADADAFAEAHERLLSDQTIQFQLREAEPEPESPDWLRGFFEMIQSDAMQGVFWFFVAGAALALLYLIALRFAGFDPPWRRKKADEPGDWRPDQGPARQLLGEADALAAQGRYSEAAHLLLYRSIEDIDTRRPDLLRPALTSRDIAALPAIPERPRGAFARIAQMVERSLFAMRPLAESDWSECRAAYEQFAFAEGWAA